LAVADAVRAVAETINGLFVAGVTSKWSLEKRATRLAELLEHVATVHVQFFEALSDETLAGFRAQLEELSELPVAEREAAAVRLKAEGRDIAEIAVLLGVSKAQARRGVEAA
jgi:hypothetical protein